MKNSNNLTIYSILDITQQTAYKIRYLRHINNIKQEILAEELGIPRSTLSDYENAKKLPTLENLIRISLYFNVGCDYLMGINDILNIDYKQNPKNYISLSRLSKRDAELILTLISAMEKAST